MTGGRRNSEEAKAAKSKSCPAELLTTWNLCGAVSPLRQKWRRGSNMRLRNASCWPSNAIFVRASNRVPRASALIRKEAKLAELQYGNQTRNGKRANASKNVTAEMLRLFDAWEKRVLHFPKRSFVWKYYEFDVHVFGVLPKELLAILTSVFTSWRRRQKKNRDVPLSYWLVSNSLPTSDINNGNRKTVEGSADFVNKYSTLILRRRIEADGQRCQFWRFVAFVNLSTLFRRCGSWQKKWTVSVGLCSGHNSTSPEPTKKTRPCQTPAGNSKGAIELELLRSPPKCYHDETISSITDERAQ